MKNCYRYCISSFSLELLKSSAETSAEQPTDQHAEGDRNCLTTEGKRDLF